MTRLAAVLVSAVVATSPVLSLQAPPPAPSGDLQKGIALVKEGDFEGALVELDAAVRALREQPARKDDLVRGLVYLGVAYLELNQELSARARFREAIDLDPKLDLSPREFSAQVLRLFEAVRAETGLPPPSPAPSPSGAAVPPRRVAPSPSPSPGKRGGAGLWIVGGGVAAAGAAVAVAAGGGGGGGAGTTTTTAPISGVTTTTQAGVTTTTTTTTTPGATTTTTTTNPPTTTTTTLPPCRPTISGNPVVPLAGGGGSCPVTAGTGCTWTATTNENWINISNPNGSGNGQVNFTSPLTLTSRSGTIVLANGSGECRVSQSGLAAQHGEALQWLAELDVAGGSGQVVVEGEPFVVHGRGQIHGRTARRPGETRVEALLIRGQGTPGRWRFLLSGTPVSGFRVIAGAVKSVTADSITFALAGRPGERIVFTFRTDE